VNALYYSYFANRLVSSIRIFNWIMPNSFLGFFNMKVTQRKISFNFSINAHTLVRNILLNLCVSPSFEWKNANLANWNYIINLKHENMWHSTCILQLWCRWGCLIILFLYLCLVNNSLYRIRPFSHSFLSNTNFIGKMENLR
jgi:hypothetical protein